jgi:pyruvate kinase
MVRTKPRRDPWGLVTEPARLVLDGTGEPGGPGRLAVDRTWLDRVEGGDEIRLRDMRGRSRRLRVMARVGGLVHTECDNGCFFSEGLELSRFRDGREVGDHARVGPITETPGEFRVHVGETFVMVRGAEVGTDALRDDDGKLVDPARISCAEPAVVDLLAVGERVLIDDGRLEGVVRSTGRSGAVVEVVRAPRKGLRLKEDRGINLPDTDLRLPMLSRRDRSELRTIVDLADSIGCSFVRSGDEMAYLSQVVASQGGAEVGLVAKVETEAAVFDLPDILASVTGAHPLGVMIARGDLAVELGWDRLAEYQQRILWFCQAAHVPVVWATQVLESMMRTGIPSRAELTDAAEAERAECVMLNKGDHAPEAVALLDSILSRMQDHVDHKRDLLPHLRHLD